MAEERGRIDLDRLVELSARIDSFELLAKEGPNGTVQFLPVTPDEGVFIVGACNAAPSLLRDALLLREARETGALTAGLEFVDEVAFGCWNRDEQEKFKRHAALLRRLHDPEDTG